MRIAVVGAGGVGGYFGGKLALAGVDTTFIVRGSTLAALRTGGLRVDSPSGDFHLPDPQVTDAASATGVFDVVLMAVKAWQLADAAKGIMPLVSEEGVVVPLENGIDAPDVLRPIVGNTRVAGGLCAIVSFIVEPGHIRHAAFDPIVMFGELDHTRSERLERLREAFSRAGVKAEIPPDIQHSMWTKLLFIATMSGFGALTRVAVDVWRATPEIRALVAEALREIVAVAAARGIDLGPEAVPTTLHRYDAMAAGSTASLQRDITEGKPSELDAQLGAIVRLAREARVPVPVTEFVYHALLPQERQARRRVEIPSLR